MRPYWIPTASEIDHFLVPYALKPEDTVERVEIRNPEDSTFHFLMLAITRQDSGETSLVPMWPADSSTSDIP